MLQEMYGKGWPSLVKSHVFLFDIMHTFTKGYLCLALIEFNLAAMHINTRYAAAAVVAAVFVLVSIAQEFRKFNQKQKNEKYLHINYLIMLITA